MFQGFIKIGTASPEIRVADVEFNTDRIIDMMNDACDMGVRVLVFPELCITGASCGDLFRQQRLLEAANDGLQDIIDASVGMDMLVFVGLPWMKDGKLYDVTAAVKDGSILGMVPKSSVHILNELNQAGIFEDGQAVPELIDTGLFYGESIWETDEDLPADPELFGGEDEDAAAAGVEEFEVPFEDDEEADEEIEETIEAPFGVNLVFECSGYEGLSFAVEMGGERRLIRNPSAELVSAGAAIIINPSAQAVEAGSFGRLQKEISEQSARLKCAYVSAGASGGESTTDMVFDGLRLIAENGEILGADSYTGSEEGLLINDIDFEKLAAVRRNDPAFLLSDEQELEEDYVFVGFEFYDDEPDELDRKIEKNPFVPASSEKAMCREILEIQALGLAKRLQHTNSKRILLGLSGGLDSTLALLVSLRAAELIGFGPEYVLCLSMPAFGTSEQTRDNLHALAEATKVELREINIKESILQHFKDIGHDVNVHDHAYENAQARERTQILMDIANMEGGLVVGTGDFSEAALGWCTYNGDQMSMYAVNADVPKTVIRQIIGNYAESTSNEALSAALKEVLGTPVSPELLPTDEKGAIEQKTEDIIGPYELHDFFLYHMLKYGYHPQRIAFLAEQAFRGEYDRKTILKWLGTMYSRFFASQFKRSCSVDGPKVFSVDLSPRGGLKLPSDACGSLWIKETEILKFMEN